MESHVEAEPGMLSEAAASAASTPADVAISPPVALGPLTAAYAVATVPRGLAPGPTTVPRSWSGVELAGQLERRVVELEHRLRQLRDGRHSVQAAREEAAAACAARQANAAALLPLRRDRLQAAARLREIQAQIASERRKAAECQKDCKGLQRTADRLYRELNFEEQKVSVATGVAVNNAIRTAEGRASLEEAMDVEEVSLRQAVGSMATVRERLEQRLAVERAKTSELEAAVSAKLKKGEDELEGLRQRCKLQDEELEVWKGRFLEEEAIRTSAQQTVAALREDFVRAGDEVAEQKEARRLMQQELQEVQRAHEQLRRTLQAARYTLEKETKERSEAQKLWRLQHLERVDAKAQRRQRLDQDIVIAEAPARVAK